MHARGSCAAHVSWPINPACPPSLPARPATRRFRLPDNVSAEGIKAQVKDGVLRLNIPKTETLAPKEIEVNLSEE